VERSEISKHKPDYAVFIKKRSVRLDLSYAEAKSPVNKSIFPKSDLLVNTGQEIECMLNKLKKCRKSSYALNGQMVISFVIYYLYLPLSESMIM
jgi:hypothetical protein